MWLWSVSLIFRDNLLNTWFLLCFINTWVFKAPSACSPKSSPLPTTYHQPPSLSLGLSPPGTYLSVRCRHFRTQGLQFRTVCSRPFCLSVSFWSTCLVLWRVGFSPALLFSAACAWYLFFFVCFLLLFHFYFILFVLMRTEGCFLCSYLNRLWNDASSEDGIFLVLSRIKSPCFKYWGSSSSGPFLTTSLFWTQGKIWSLKAFPLKTYSFVYCFVVLLMFVLMCRFHQSWTEDSNFCFSEAKPWKDKNSSHLSCVLAQAVVCLLFETVLTGPSLPQTHSVSEDLDLLILLSPPCKTRITVYTTTFIMTNIWWLKYSFLTIPMAIYGALGIV